MKLWAFISTTIYGRPRPSIGWKAKLSYPTKGSNGKSISSKHFEDYHFLPLILLSFFPKFSYPEISFSSTLLSSAPQFFCSNTRKHITLYFFFILSSISISLFLSHFKTRKWYTNQRKNQRKSFFVFITLKCPNSPLPIHGVTSAAKRRSPRRSTISSTTTTQSTSHSQQIARAFE